MKVMKRMLGTLLLVTAVWAVATVAWGDPSQVDVSNKETLDAIFGGNSTTYPAGVYNVTLNADIIEGSSSGDPAGKTLEVKSGYTINLNLNNHYIKSTALRNVFKIASGGTLKIYDNSSEKGGYIKVLSQGSTSTSTAANRAILNEGVLVLESGTIKDGAVTSSAAATRYGLAIYNKGFFTMSGGEISNFSSTTQRGVIYNTGTMTISGGTIKGNTVRNDSGIIYGYGSITITGGTFEDSSNNFKMFNARKDTTSPANISISGGVIYTSNLISAETEATFTLKISGGWFKSNVDAQYLESGYTATGECDDYINENAKYTVANSATYTVSYLDTNGNPVTDIYGDSINHNLKATIKNPSRRFYWNTKNDATGKSFNGGEEVEFSKNTALYMVPFVAEVNETQYSSLNEAWTAAIVLSGDQTVKLLHAVELDSALTDIPKTSNIIFDLNSCELLTSQRLVNVLGGYLKITDSSLEPSGTISYNGDLDEATDGFITIKYGSPNNGQLVFEKVTIKDISTDGYPIALIKSNNSGTIIDIISGGIEATPEDGIAVDVLNSPSINVSGGNIKGKIQVSGTGAINISAGTIFGSVDAGSNGTIYISGGTVDGALSLNGKKTITGGVFSSNPTAFVDTNYAEITANMPESGKWTVTALKIARVTINSTTTEYASFVDAIEATNGKTATITMLKDISIPSSQAAFDISGIDSKVTLDLNGHVISGASGHKYSLFYVTDGATLKIKDAGITKGAAVNAYATTDNGAVVNVELATFILDGATISNSTAKNNGGAVYVIGGSFTMTDGAIITTCSSSNKNSGAVHVTRKNNGDGSYTGSTFTMESGSKIENCSATNGGDAVSIGSQCIFNFENGAIIKCSLTGGSNTDSAKAIFIDAAGKVGRDENEVNVYGTVYLKGTIQDKNGVEVTGDDLDSTYIKSYGLVYTWDSVSSKYVLTDDYQQYSAARIIGIAPVLSDSISLRVYYEFAGADADDEKTLALRYKLGNGTEIISTDSSSDTSGTYFIVPGITADMIDKVATVQITFDEYANDTSNAYSRDDLTESGTMSVKQYCEYVISVAEDTSVSEELRSSKLQNLVKSVLIYGSEARKYNDGEYIKVGSTDEDYKVNSDLYTTLNGVGGFAIPESCDPILSGTKNENNVFVKAYVKVGSKVQVVIQYKTNGDGTNVSVGDTPISNTTCAESIYTKVFDELKPTEFDEAYVVKINHSTDETLTLTYSVNTYCIRMQNDTGVGALVKAMYLYGKAAEAYIAE